MSDDGDIDGPLHDLTMPRFTRIERRLLDAFADGQRHAYDELCQAVDIEVATLHVHLQSIRRKLAPACEYVVCEVDNHGKRYFRHVILLTSRQRAEA